MAETSPAFGLPSSKGKSAIRGAYAEGPGASSKMRRKRLGLKDLTSSRHLRGLGRRRMPKSARGSTESLRCTGTYEMLWGARLSLSRFGTLVSATMPPAIERMARSFLRH